MNASLVTCAVLFGPAAVTGPALAAAWWRHRGEHDAALAVFADVRTTAGPGSNGPPDGGQPTPTPEPAPGSVGQLADVIELNTRRDHAA